MAFADEKHALSRERRSGAMSAYHGSLQGLISLTEGEIRQTVRTFSQCAPDEIIAAHTALCGIEGAAIVVHGGAGCAASSLGFPRNDHIRWYSTNLDEKDSILGGDDHLRDAIARACAECSPEVIFVVGTPVVAINNDDVNSVILEAAGEGGAKIVFVGTDGFKSKTAVTGYDVVSHAFLRELIERSSEKEGFVNVISMSESARDISSCLSLLRNLGIDCNAFPRYSTASRIRRAGRGRATVALNGSEGEYLAKGLEESFGVKFVPTDAPIGVAATARFVRAIASELGLESEAEKYIEKLSHSADDLASEAPLEGAGFFLNMGLAAATGFKEMINELGGTVVGLAVPYIDANNRELLKKWASPETIAVVANGQPFEIANALSKIKPDYYVGGAGMTSFASRFGAAPISTERGAFYGIDGFREFARRAAVAARAKRPAHMTPGGFYKAQWLAKSGNWHVKMEVK
jgi:nitrogenase molybdenum-iron protein alpha chain